VKKRKIKAITAFKVIQGHRGGYQSKARSHRSLLFKFWTLCIFEPPFGGLGTTYDVHLGIIGKRVVDFLLVLIELFSLGVTAESLRAKRDRKSAISLQRCHFDPKFQVEWVAFPPIIFALLVRPMNALQLCC